MKFLYRNSYLIGVLTLIFFLGAFFIGIFSTLTIGDEPPKAVSTLVLNLEIVSAIFLFLISLISIARSIKEKRYFVAASFIFILIVISIFLYQGLIYFGNVPNNTRVY